jgi:hypothetical protein
VTELTNGWARPGGEAAVEFYGLGVGIAARSQRPTYAKASVGTLR